MNEPKVRIFVSSPADVEHERAIVKDIIERLARDFLPYFEIQPILWEEEALTADRSFQAGLLRPADCDIVLVVLWTRLGSPLPEQPYGGMTGTEWEFFNAVETSPGKGAPEVLVYKKTNPKLVDITDSRTAQEAMEDRARLEEFFQRNFFNADQTFRRAFRGFDSDASFRNLVENQLRKLLNRRIFMDKRGSERTSDWRGSPFRPERPFGIADERIFTGRETEIRELLRRLQEQMDAGSGLVLISGPSGCGKTSLIRAGLIPRLVRPYQIDGVSVCRWCLVEPRIGAGNPLASLAEALCGRDVLGESLQGFGIGPELLRNSLSRDPAFAASQIRAALKGLTLALGGDSGKKGARARLMIVIDPLDALLAGDDGAGSGSELDSLTATLSALATSGPVWVLALMRSDYLGRLSRLGALAALVDDRAWLRLEVPANARIRQIMEIPALVAGLQYESQGTRSVVDSLEAEASRVPPWPPLLQGALDDLYLARESTVGDEDADSTPGPQRSGYLTLTALQQGGGMAAYALRRAQLLWDDLEEETRRGLPMLCRALVTLERTANPQPVPRTGDLETLETDSACRSLLRALLDARLLVAQGEHDPVLLMKCHQPDYSLKASLRRILRQDREGWRLRGSLGRGPRSPEAFADGNSSQTERATPPVTDWDCYRRTVFLSHPSLLERWKPCRDWLSRRENREALQLRYQISRQAQLWKRTECNREYLLGEVGFAAATRFSRAHRSELEPLEEEFLRQSDNHLRFERRRNALVRITGGVLLVLLLLATSAAFWAWDASRTATVNLHRSGLKAAELAIVRGDTPSAVVLALDAGRYLPQRAQETLSQAFTANRLIALVHEGPPLAGLPLSAAIDDEGLQVATVDPSLGVRMWRLADDRFIGEEEPVAYEQGFHSVLFAGTGTQAAFYAIAPQGVWRLPAEQESQPLFPCGAEPGASFALDTSGRRLALSHALAPDEYGVCLMDLSRPSEPVFDVVVHSAAISSLAFSPGGKRLLTASKDGTAQVLDTSSGRVLHGLQPHQSAEPLRRAVFHPGGERIAIASTDESPRIFGSDGALLRRLGKVSNGAQSRNIHNAGIQDLAFTPDGRFLVSADGDGLVVRWDLEGERETALVLGHHNQGVDRMRLGPQGRRLLTASLDKTARLWEIDSGKELAVFSHDGAVTDAVFSAGGRRVFTQSARDGTARLWSIDHQSPLSELLPHDDHVQDLSFSPANEQGDFKLATGGSDGRVSVWSFHREMGLAANTGVLVLQGHFRGVRRVAFSAGGERVASASIDGTAIVWDIETNEIPGRELCRLEPSGDGERIQANRLLFDPSPEGRWLLTISSAALAPVTLWDLETCRPFETGDLQGGGTGVQAATLERTDSGTLVATGSDDGRVRIIREVGPGNWEPLCDSELHSRPVRDLDLSPDGHWLVSASEDRLARLLRVDGCAGEKKVVNMVGHVDTVQSARFSPDGQWVVTASRDGTARVWTASGEQRLELTGHNNRVNHAEFSPDGRWILTASEDGMVRLWQSPRPSSTQKAMPYLVLRSDQGGSPYASFSPDGRYIGAAYWGNAALLWRIWADDEELTPDVVAELREVWGEERSELALIREAVRFRIDNRLDELRGTQEEDD